MHYCTCQHLQQYAQIARPSVESINRFIADSFPSSIDVVDSGGETSTLARPVPVMLVASGRSHHDRLSMNLFAG